MGVHVRAGKFGEEAYLSDLAIRSKAYWGYSLEFLDACRPHLKIDSTYLKDWPVYVLEKDSVIIGFYSLKTIKNENRLDQLWIEPNFIRNGFGKILFAHAISTAKTLGWNSLRLAGEPDAVVFYEKMGAKLIGQVQSRLSNDLFLPLMEIQF